MRNIKSFLANLPSMPGIYQMLGQKGEVIYVGKAKNLKKRVSSYFSGSNKDPKTQLLVKNINDIDFTVTNSDNEAVLLECNLIKKLRPRYNILLRDDKSYPYILITQHAFPRIEMYRGTRKKNGRYFGPFPSSLAVRETIRLLQKMFRLRTCRDSYYDARTRPCLLYQIGRCSGPCVGIVSEEEYAANVALAVLFLEGKSREVINSLQSRMQQAADNHHYELAAHYRDQIINLQKILETQHINLKEGNADMIGFSMQSGLACLQVLSIRNGQILGSKSYFPAIPAHSGAEEIISAFLSQYYLQQANLETVPREILLAYALSEGDMLEKALSDQSGRIVKIFTPQRGEKKKWLSMANDTAKQSLIAHLYNKINMHERFASLKEMLALKKQPKRIECFDISHTGGEETVGSCVVFSLEGALKADYRHYNITGITPGDDVAAMRQVIQRRFKRAQKEEGSIPDLVLIDGGKTQLTAAQAIFNETCDQHVVFIGVSKGPGRKAGFESLHLVDGRVFKLPADALALHLIQQIRDEAHRFAITGHRNRRDKKRRHSFLEDIAGIGAKRRRELLRYFGGIQGIAHASLEELTKVPGISSSLAHKIFAALHDTTT